MKTYGFNTLIRLALTMLRTTGPWVIILNLNSRGVMSCIRGRYILGASWPVPVVDKFLLTVILMWSDIWNVFIYWTAVRASHRYREVTGSNPVEVLTFSGFCSQLLKLRWSWLTWVILMLFLTCFWDSLTTSRTRTWYRIRTFLYFRILVYVSRKIFFLDLMQVPWMQRTARN